MLALIIHHLGSTYTFGRSVSSGRPSWRPLHALAASSRCLAAAVFRSVRMCAITGSEAARRLQGLPRAQALLRSAPSVAVAAEGSSDAAAAEFCKCLCPGGAYQWERLCLMGGALPLADLAHLLAASSCAPALNCTPCHSRAQIMRLLVSNLTFHASTGICTATVVVATPIAAGCSGSASSHFWGPLISMQCWCGTEQLKAFQCRAYSPGYRPCRRLRDLSLQQVKLQGAPNAPLPFPSRLRRLCVASNIDHGGGESGAFVPDCTLLTALEHLSLNTAPFVLPDSLVTRLPQLTELRLASGAAYHVTAGDLRLGALSALRALALHSVVPAPVDSNLTALPHLSRLRITGSMLAHAEAHFLPADSDNLPPLQHLTLWASNPQGWHSTPAVLPNLTQLVELELRQSPLEPLVVPELAALTRLSRLVLVSGGGQEFAAADGAPAAGHDAVAAFDWLLGLTRMQELHVPGLITFHGDRKLGPLHCLANMRMLRRINLGTSDATVAQVRAVAAVSGAPCWPLLLRNVPEGNLLGLRLCL